MGFKRLKYSDRGKSGSALQLWQQTYKYMSHANARSFNSRISHLDRLSTFVSYVGDTFKLQKLENLQDKHIISFIDDAFAKGKSTSLVWNTVSSVQYLGQQMPGDHKFSDTNDIKALYVEYRKSNDSSFRERDIQRHLRESNANPAWTSTERENATKLALEMKRYDVALSLQFGAELGTRLHETFRQDRKALGRAIDNGQLRTKGKGGQYRDIPLDSPVAREAVERAYRQTGHQNEKAFVNSDRNAKQCMKSVQNWIYYHRDKFAETEDKQLTYHGLRHTYAQQQLERRLEHNDGKLKEAMLEVSELLGHHREWIVNIYLDK